MNHLRSLGWSLKQASRVDDNHTTHQLCDIPCNVWVLNHLLTEMHIRILIVDWLPWHLLRCLWFTSLGLDSVIQSGSTLNHADSFWVLNSPFLFGVFCFLLLQVLFVFLLCRSISWANSWNLAVTNFGFKRDLQDIPVSWSTPFANIQKHENPWFFVEHDLPIVVFPASMLVLDRCNMGKPLTSWIEAPGCFLIPARGVTAAKTQPGGRKSQEPGS